MRCSHVHVFFFCVFFYSPPTFFCGGQRVVSVDLVPSEEAAHNIIVSAQDVWAEQARKIGEALAAVRKAFFIIIFCTLFNSLYFWIWQYLGEGKLAAIMCVAGGWSGGNAASEDLVAVSELMFKQSVWPSVVSAQLAAHHLAPGGTLVLTGALAALQGTSGMIGYGMAKVGSGACCVGGVFLNKTLFYLFI